MTRPTALIAEDEPLMRERLKEKLAEAWPELDIVAEAKNGIEAVALTEEHRPDLVFLDIRMPGMTGVEAARAIAQLPIDAATSSPVRPGMRMSRKAICGCHSCSISSAWLPSAASATMSSSGQASASFSFNRSRISGSSSAISAVGRVIGQRLP